MATTAEENGRWVFRKALADGRLFEWEPYSGQHSMFGQGHVSRINGAEVGQVYGPLAQADYQTYAEMTFAYWNHGRRMTEEREWWKEAGRPGQRPGEDGAPWWQPEAPQQPGWYWHARRALVDYAPWGMELSRVPAVGPVGQPADPRTSLWWPARIEPPMFPCLPPLMSPPSAVRWSRSPPPGGDGRVLVPAPGIWCWRASRRVPEGGWRVWAYEHKDPVGPSGADDNLWGPLVVDHPQTPSQPQDICNVCGGCLTVVRGSGCFCPKPACRCGLPPSPPSPPTMPYPPDGVRQCEARRTTGTLVEACMKEHGHDAHAFTFDKPFDVVRPGQIWRLDTHETPGGPRDWVTLRQDGRSWWCRTVVVDSRQEHLFDPSWFDRKKEHPALLLREANSTLLADGKIYEAVVEAVDAYPTLQNLDRPMAGRQPR